MTAISRILTVTTAGVVAVASATLVLGTSTSAGEVPGRLPSMSARPGGHSIELSIPPRLQWDANDGYCGEVSMIRAGLANGQYLSQYDARAIASPHIPQSRPGSQLLLGVNGAAAARRMRLAARPWRPFPEATTRDFLIWIESQLIQGHPVAVGIYTNEYRLYGITAPTAGDPSYDHIVLITGITSRHPLTLPARYDPDDRLTFSDNGLWTGTRDDRPPRTFSYTFRSFQATRRQANARTGAIYSLPDATRDEGLAFTGVLDPEHETLPVDVRTSTDRESPAIRDGSSSRPRATALRLVVTVSGLTPGRSYRLYRYDSVTRVPVSRFNAQRSAAARRWTFVARGATSTFTQVIRSSDEVIYRAVRASAP